MLVTREMLALVGAASKDTTRGALAGVRLEAPGFAVATDGHVLAVLEDRTCDPARLEDWPLDAGLELVDYDKPVTIPLDACKATLALMRAQGKRWSLTEFPGRAWLVETPGGPALAVLNGDLRYQLVPFKPLEGQYPDWTKVWPSAWCEGQTADDVRDIGFGSGLLQLVGKLCEDCLSKRADYCTVAWRFNGPKSAGEFQAHDSERTLRGLLMPLRLDDYEYRTGTPSAPDFTPKPSSKETTVEAIMGHHAQTATAAA